VDLSPVSKVISKYEKKRTALISILHDIQDHYHYLPEGALKKVASQLRMDLNDLYGVATFYKSFSLTPKGKHLITLCLGTACHVRGGPKILRELKKQLSIGPGQTTQDGQYSLNVVNCLGACAIGPVLVLDGKLSGEMNSVKAKGFIERLKVNKRRGPSL